MTLLTQLKADINNCLLAHFPKTDISKVSLETCKDPTHGDFATNIAMVCAKNLKLSPKFLAEKILSDICALKSVQNAEVAGPGFINLQVKPSILIEELKEISQTRKGYGNGTVGEGKTVNIEYVSVNPTGPLHIGHGRNAVFGDVLANLYQKSGYTVTREYYVNDAGGQTLALARSLFMRYREYCGETLKDTDFDQDMYKGDYLKPVARDFFNEHGKALLDQPKAKWLPLCQKYAVHAMMKCIETDLNKLGIKMDVFTSERKLTADGWVDKALACLTQQGDIYKGMLEKPKGHIVDDWEDREQTLFRSTKYGDDNDRALKKSDGTWTYFAGDVGYHFKKISAGVEKIINVLGADHVGYIKRITAAVKSLAPKVDFYAKTYQMVNFIDNGEPVRMSKRSGNFVTIDQLLARVDRDSFRYMMVSRHQNQTIDFDFQQVVEMSKDNPIFYVQYAHARVYSVIRQAMQTFKKIPSLNGLEYLETPEELGLIKKLILWPKVVELAVEHLEPHRVTNYLHDLASCFHSLWNMGKDNMQLRFIDPNNEASTAARLYLLEATAKVIAEGLHVLGIVPLEELRS